MAFFSQLIKDFSWLAKGFSRFRKDFSQPKKDNSKKEDLIDFDTDASEAIKILDKYR